MVGSWVGYSMIMSMQSTENRIKKETRKSNISMLLEQHPPGLYEHRVHTTIYRR